MKPVVDMYVAYYFLLFTSSWENSWDIVVWMCRRVDLWQAQGNFPVHKSSSSLWFISMQQAKLEVSVSDHEKIPISWSIGSKTPKFITHCEAKSFLYLCGMSMHAIRSNHFHLGQCSSSGRPQCQKKRICACGPRPRLKVDSTGLFALSFYSSSHSSKSHFLKFSPKFQSVFWPSINGLGGLGRKGPPSNLKTEERNNLLLSSGRPFLST